MRMQAGGHALVVYPPHERLGHPEANERICWPAILAVLAVQMIVLSRYPLRWPTIPVSGRLHRQTSKLRR
jgi:hypothetical protein